MEFKGTETRQSTLAVFEEGGCGKSALERP
jgi:hypothetical protein